MAKLQAEKGVKKAIVNTLVSASRAYVRARRTSQGVDLQYALQPRPLLVGLWATVLTVLLAPLHALATKLVYGKVRSIGESYHAVIANLLC